MSVKVANTCAARNDGVALGIDRDQPAIETQNVIATATARWDDHPNETLQCPTAKVFGGVLSMQPSLGVD
jgi:hypothetical protein